MPTGEGVRIIECVYGPRVTHIIRGAYTEEVRTGVWKKYPGMKIEWKRNGHGEFICDLWDIAEKCAKEERRTRLIQDSQSAQDARVEELKKIIWEHLMTMPEWEIKKIVPYVEWEDKLKVHQQSILDQMPPDVIAGHVDHLKEIGVLPGRLVEDKAF